MIKWATACANTAVRTIETEAHRAWEVSALETLTEGVRNVASLPHANELFILLYCCAFLLPTYTPEESCECSQSKIDWRLLEGSCMGVKSEAAPHPRARREQTSMVFITNI